MANCIMCRKQVHSYPGYVTDGIVAVCNECAASNSLARIMTRIENSELEVNLKSVFSMPVTVEASLVDQTNESVAVNDNHDIDSEQREKYPESGMDQNNRVELDKSKLDAVAELTSDIENMSQEDFYSKYADNVGALNAYHDANGEPAEFLEV